MEAMLERMKDADPQMVQQLMNAFQSLGSSPQQLADLLQRAIPNNPASSKQDLTAGNLEEEIEQSKRVYDSIQLRKGQKAPFIPPHHLILSHRQQRKELIEARKKSSPAIVRSTIFDLYCSKVTDLSTLSRIYINDLRMEIWHKGKYLLCRTIEEPLRYNAINSIIEDEKGDISMISLYNFTRNLKDDCDYYIPSNTILLIKEPYFKASAGGATMVRCDSPSDVVSINYKDDNYERLNVSSIRNWDSLAKAADRVYSAPCPQSPLEWKNRGNDLYKKGFWKDAARAYSIGMSKDNEQSNILRLNRAAAYLQMGRFDDSAEDAVQVLDSSPNNVKALTRAAKSFYQLRTFRKALQYFERLVELDPSSKDQIEVCRQRAKEEALGEYDWEILASSKNSRLDAADYWNSDFIKVAHISREKGRGVIAKKDIPPGTLLVVCKAFSISFADEVKDFPIFQINLKDKSGNTSADVHEVAGVVHKILECPSLGDSVYQLWSGEVVEENLDKGITDYERIYRICKLNSFSRMDGVTDADLNKTEPESRDNDSDLAFKLKNGTGLWITSSFFNHSCVPNSTYRFIGDLMVIKSTRVIKAGEEVSVTYVSAERNLEKRKSTFDHFGFKCKCVLCKEQNEMNQKLFDDLREKFNKTIRPRVLKNDIRVIPILEKHIDAIKNAYNRHSQSKFLFELFAPMTGLGRLYHVKGKYSEYVKSMEDIFVLCSNISNFDEYVSGKYSDDVYFSKSLLLLVKDLALATQDFGMKKKASQWAKMLVMFEGYDGIDSRVNDPED